MRKFSLVLLLAILASFFVACDSKSALSAVEIKYDREICERCRMIISDRKHAAQIVNPATKERFYFDDIGCAVLWQVEQKHDWADQALIFVNDYDTGEWLDARRAVWSTEQVTSMSFGMVAHKTADQVDMSEPHRKIIDYAEVVKRVRERGK